MEMVEHDDRWSLATHISEITGICFGQAISLHIEWPCNIVDVHIEDNLEILTGSSETKLRLPVSNIGLELAPVLYLAGRRVRRMDAFKDGRLEIEVADHCLLRIAPDNEGESWEITARRGMRLAAVPGGSLAVWRG